MKRSHWNRVLISIATLFVVGCAAKKTVRTAEKTSLPAGTFEELDQDGNKTIEIREFRENAALLFDAGDKDRDGFIGASELEGQADWYRKADRSKDKKISIIEFMAKSDEVFSEADKNRDGKLSRNESKPVVPAK